MARMTRIARMTCMVRWLADCHYTYGTSDFLNLIVLVGICFSTMVSNKVFQKWQQGESRGQNVLYANSNMQDAH